jgi:hypothetical protein
MYHQESRTRRQDDLQSVCTVAWSRRAGREREGERSSTIVSGVRAGRPVAACSRRCEGRGEPKVTSHEWRGEAASARGENNCLQPPSPSITDCLLAPGSAGRIEAGRPACAAAVACMRRRRRRGITLAGCGSTSTFLHGSERLSQSLLARAGGAAAAVRLRAICIAYACMPAHLFWSARPWPLPFLAISRQQLAHPVAAWPVAKLAVVGDDGAREASRSGPGLRRRAVRLQLFMLWTSMIS